MLERYLIPLAPYLFVAATLAVSTFIFYSLKKEIHGLRARLSARDADFDAASGAVRLQIEEMHAELRHAEERTAQLVPPTPPRSGLNLNKRTQVLRMFRHGEAEENIAAKLGLPRQEVKLVLKVHKLASNAAALEPATSSSDGR